jgi:hypothetical protein
MLIGLSFDHSDYIMTVVMVAPALVKSASDARGTPARLYFGPSEVSAGRPFPRGRGRHGRNPSAL